MKKKKADGGFLVHAETLDNVLKIMEKKNPGLRKLINKYKRIKLKKVHK